MYTAMVFLLLLTLDADAQHIDWHECHVSAQDPLFRITKLEVSPYPPILPPFKINLTLEGYVTRDMVIKEFEFTIFVDRRHFNGHGRRSDVKCSDHLGCNHTVKCTRVWMVGKVIEDFFGLGPIIMSLLTRMGNASPLACPFYKMPFSVEQHTFLLPIRVEPTAISEPGIYSITMIAYNENWKEQLMCLKLEMHLWSRAMSKKIHKPF